MKTTIIATLLVLIAFTYAVSLSMRNFSVVPTTTTPVKSPGSYDYRGIINAQTNSSAGYLTPQEVITIGQDIKDKKIDFLFLQELNQFAQAAKSFEGWQRQLLVIAGSKYSYLESRLLALNPSRLKAAESLGQAQTIIADLISNSTRPEMASDSLILGQASRDGTDWIGNIPDGISGLEVLNIYHYINRLWYTDRLTLLWSLIIYPFNPDLALIRLFADLDTEFRLWDRVSHVRPMFGVLGSDAGQPVRLLGIPMNIPSYETMFNTASNHVLLKSELTGDFESDRKKIIHAILSGNSYFAFDSLGDTKGFSFLYKDQTGEHPLGSRIRLHSRGGVMKIHLPQKPSVQFSVRVLRDGASIFNSTDTDTEVAIQQPGVYRVVVRLFMNLTIFDGYRWVPWIITNPITVTARHD